MPVICEQLRLAYFPVPKVACTSLKSYFFRLNNRADFNRIRVGDRHLSIHQIPGYAEEAFSPEFRTRFAAYERIAVVRDPLDRLVSAFKNKIAKARIIEGSPDAVRACRLAGLPENPDLHTFLLSVDAYAEASAPIRHHVVSQGYFLGDDLGFYDRIVRCEDLRSLEDFISARLGRFEEIPHLNATGRAGEVAAIAPEARRAAIRFCRRDYEFLHAFYPIPPEQGREALLPEREAG